MTSSIARWALTLGATGLLCGFIGPMVLNPWANQGPLVGLLITGPGGALLGAALGVLVAACGVTPAVARRLLAVVAAVGGLAILVVALPEPEYRATVLDLEVRQCEPALDWEARGVALWEKRLEANAPIWGAPSPDWRQAFAREAASGSVVTIAVRRHRDIVASRRFWDFGTVMATPWSTARSRRMARPNHVYMRDECAAAPVGAIGTFLARAAPVEARFPPRDPSLFLDMLALEQLPAEYLEFAR